MSEFFLELFSEEIPSSLQKNLRIDLTNSFNKLFEWHSIGKLKPHISNILPLEKANEALDLLRERKATGKVIVKVD